jgi:Putative peptidoglycan binding domain
MMHGFDADTIWSHAKNADVNDLRKSPNLLHPGDVLHFPRAKRPGQPLSKGTSNAYTADVPRTTVSLGFNDAAGPLAGKKYVVEGLGAPEEGTTDGGGTINLDVPVHVREVRVKFPEQHLSYVVRIGDMDPVEEPAGVRKRLQHLGYREPDGASDGDTEAEREARDRSAVAAFQQAKGMDPNGDLDDATRAALVAEHGT